MKNLEKTIKKRYIMFISLIVLIMLSILFFVQTSINAQIADSRLINIAEKQRNLSQRISNLSFLIGSNQNTKARRNFATELNGHVNTWDSLHDVLQSANKPREAHVIIDSLLNINETYRKEMLFASNKIVNSSNEGLLQEYVNQINNAEKPYLNNLDILVKQYQRVEEGHLKKLKTIIYFLVFGTFLMLFSGFITVLRPAYKAFIKKNRESEKSFEELALSESKIKENLVELERLKTDLEIKETYNKIFIEQAPTAIAMLDTDMCYIAVSKKWIADYKMEGLEIVGRSHYDLFPEIGDDWKEDHQNCLKGDINVCEEAPFVRKDGSIQWIYWDVRPWYKAEGKVGGLIMHTGDITHLKEKESEKTRIQKILDKTNEVARIGTWDVDLVNNTVYWSKMVCQIHGLPDDFQPEKEEDSVFYYKEGKSRDTIIEVYDAAVEHGTPFDVELEIVTMQGKEIWIRSIGQAEMVSGKCVRVFGLFQDIDKMKRSQINLRKANGELEAILNSEAVAIVSTNPDGIITHFNRGAEVLTGYSAAEVVGVERPKLYHLQDDLDRFRKDIAIRYGKRPEKFNAPLELSYHDDFDRREWTYLRKDGTALPVELTLTSIKDVNKNLIGYLGISTDISERKRAKEELLRNNQLLNFAEEITSMGNWQWDLATNIVKWSNNMYGIFGVDKKETIVTYETYFSFVHPEDRDLVAGFVERSVTGKSDEKELIHRIVTSSGEVKILKLLGVEITNNQGEVLEIIGACQDVTEQKMAETELLRKNHFLSFAEIITKMGNWWWDVDTNNVKWSAGLHEIFEHDKGSKDTTLDTYFGYIHPEDREKVKNAIQEAFVTRTIPDNFTHRVVSGTGKIKTVQLLGEVLLNDKGAVIEMMGTMQDITEQKMEENKFRGLLESAPDAMVITNEDSKIQMINKQAEKMFGYKIEELFNKSVDLLLPKRFLSGCDSKVNTLLSNLVGTESSGDEDLAAMNKEGKEFPVQITLSPLETEDGVLVSAAIRDITAQKLGKAELLRKNQLLTFAEKITMMGNWQLNVVTNEVKWSSNLYNIFGVESDTHITQDIFLSFVHPEDKERVEKHLENAIESKVFDDLMHRIKLKDGTVKTVNILAEVIINNNGEVIEIIGTCQDVTEQRMAENKFRGLLESAPDAMVITNEDSKIQIINKQAEKLFGYKIEEIYNKPVDMLLPSHALENHQLQRKLFLNERKTKALTEGEDLFAVTKEGREFPIQMSLSPLKTEEGMLISAAIRDVTEQKIAKNRIISAKNDLEILAQKLTKNNEQLADFAHITSHNLRAPVSNLNSLLGLYNITEKEEDKVSLFKKFEKVIDHLTVTLNSLVDAIRIKNNASKKLETIYFDDVLNKTKEILTGEVIKNNALVTSDFSSIAKIKYDRIYLESIFLNLVGNSIKYRAKDRIPEIFIKSEIVNGKISLQFQDNGLGIDLEKHGHKLFGFNKVFHRHPEAKGVGLFMVKTQVEALNGTINATSEVNKGTTFTINF